MSDLVACSEDAGGKGCETVQDDERAASGSDRVWAVITIGLWVIAIALAVWLVATTLFG